MGIVRYVKSPEDLQRAQASNPEFLPSTCQQVVIDYLTDPALASAIVPRPLVASPEGKMRVVLSHVAMHMPGGFDLEIGSAVFGVHCTYEGQPGYYIVTMPMTTESAVVGGRETYGEPKKIADIQFTRQGDTVEASVSRHGFTYLRFKGVIGEEQPARQIKDHAYCFKLFPSPSGQGFDHDPLLVRLNLLRKQEKAHAIQGELVLGESPLDPVADLPVRSIVSMQYEQMQSESNGEVLRSVPAEWLYPFSHQRYDDFSALLGGKQ